MLIGIRLINRFEPFCLGFCKCGCSQEINTRVGHYLKKYCIGHSGKGKRRDLFGSKNPRWNGGNRKTWNGYNLVLRPNHFNLTRKDKYILEHRYNYEIFYQCCLLSYVDIHHIDENKLNSKIENLIPYYKNQHTIIGNKKDLSDRFCIICGSKETSYNSSGNPDWFIHNDGFICRVCYRLRESGKIK